MRPALIQRLRAWTQLLDQRLGGRHWFQHVPLALLLGRGGLWILNARFGRRLEPICARPDGGRFPPESQVVAFPANWRRHGYHGPWPAVALASGLGDGGPATVHLHVDSAGVFRISTAALLFAWRHFNRSSVAASTLFTLSAVVMLLLYATCGSYYLGAAFKPLCDGDHEHGRLPRYRSCCAGGETAHNFRDCSRRSGVRHLADRCDRTVG